LKDGAIMSESAAGQAGYLDLQVNGYGGVDFQDDHLTADALHEACALMRVHGCGGFLGTIITEDVAKMERRLRNIVAYRDRDPLIRETIAGLHIEGPFLSPLDGFRGAHPRDAIRPADAEIMKRLLDAAGGLAKIVTLAPEHDADLRVTRMVADLGIRVSAGHTDASLELLEAAIDAGLSMFTHLGNGCPMHMHRHENIVQRALSLSDKLWPMFIADGAHVAYPALGNYLRVVGLDRAIVVTDAVAPAGKGPGRFQLGRWDMVIGQDLVARAPDGSHLVGSAMNMPQATQRLIQQVGLSREQALRLTVHNPRMVMGYDCDCDECRQRGDRRARAERVGHSREDAGRVAVVLPRRGGNGQPGGAASPGRPGLGVPGAS
jgi:N-acetylglucosamine-6-phosphate deacetylase